MDAVKFLKEKERMCNNYEVCYECPLSAPRREAEILYCNSFIGSYPEEAIEIVEKWSKEH